MLPFEKVGLKLQDSETVRSRQPSTAVSQTRKDNPKKGVLFYLLHTVVLTLNLYTSKLLFNLNPSVSVTQFMFMRGFIATIMMIIWTLFKGGLGKNLIDPVNRSNIWSLIFRCT